MRSLSRTEAMHGLHPSIDRFGGMRPFKAAF
jgi:hypothetical protein